jgi:hypothetical protein
MADHCPATVGLDLCFEGSGGQVFENKFREQAAKDGVFLERRVEWVRMVAWTGMAVKLLLLGSRRAAAQLLAAALSSVALLVLSHLPHSRLPQLRCVCARSPVAAAQGRAWWRAWLPAPRGRGRAAAGYGSRQRSCTGHSPLLCLCHGAAHWLQAALPCRCGSQPVSVRVGLRQPRRPLCFLRRRRLTWKALPGFPSQRSVLDGLLHLLLDPAIQVGATT